MFIAEEEHEGNRVVKFVHLFEVGDLIEIADIDDGEVLDAVGNAVKDFVLSHAVGVPVSSEADNHESLFFGKDRLVDVPPCNEMWENDGSHDV